MQARVVRSGAMTHPHCCRDVCSTATLASMTQEQYSASIHPRSLDNVCSSTTLREAAVPCTAASRQRLHSSTVHSLVTSLAQEASFVAIPHILRYTTAHCQETLGQLEVECMATIPPFRCRIRLSPFHRKGKQSPVVTTRLQRSTAAISMGMRVVTGLAA